MKARNLLIELISSLFILLFIYTALSKFYNLETFQAVLAKSPLLDNVNILVSWLVPISETILAVFLFIPRLRLLGLYGAFIMMTCFTIYISYMLVFTPNLPCSCGGVINTLSWSQHLLFNIFFTILALVAILLKKGKLTFENRKKYINNPAHL